MTGYQNLLLEGEKIGIQKGEKIGIQKGEKIGILREDQRKTLSFVLDLLAFNMEDKAILEVTKISPNTFQLLQSNYIVNFKIENLQIELAQHLIQIYTYLRSEDIATFCRLSIEHIENLKQSKK